VYYFNHHFYLHYLYSAWVKHDTNTGRGSRGRKVGTELGTDNAACTMGTCDLAPDATKFSFFGSLFLLGFVNEGNSFTHVELCFTFVTDVLQFEQRCFFVLISQTTFVTHDKTSNIQTAQNKEGDGEGLIKRKKISIAPDKTMVEGRGWRGRGLGRIDVVEGLIELAFTLHH
jgi:hypothetical protein